jgi:hypothetical protein
LKKNNGQKTQKKCKKNSDKQESLENKLRKQKETPTKDQRKLKKERSQQK